MQDYTVSGKEIANNIKAERNRIGLKQTDVAEKLKVSVKTYISYEEDARNVKSTDLSILARLFGCDISDFYVQRKFTKREKS